jgi:MFS family permease
VSSALFAGSLAFAPNPLVLAALWILSGAAWAAVIPVQQAVVAEASAPRVGRGMGLYESAVLLGSLVGALVAGLLYDGSSWEVACLVLAALILSGAVIVPRAVRAVGVPDVPVEVRPVEQAPLGEPVPHGSATQVALAAAEGAGPAGPVQEAPTEARPARTPREMLRELASHAAVYVAAQVVLAVIGLSWLVDVVTGRDPDHEGLANLAHSGGRIWTVVLAVDAAWTLWKVLRSRRE